jgi:hypothetical protein
MEIEDEKKYIENMMTMMKNNRDEEFKSSPQLSLGELIKKIQKANILRDDGSPKSMTFDFGTAIPDSLDSWRGSYCELAVGYSMCERNSESRAEPMKADKFLVMLKQAIGEDFEGWKGGEFTMDENTPLWVANPGDSGNTAIVGVLDKGWYIVLQTEYCEY